MTRKPTLILHRLEKQAEWHGAHGGPERVEPVRAGDLLILTTATRAAKQLADAVRNSKLADERTIANALLALQRTHNKINFDPPETETA